MPDSFKKIESRLELNPTALTMNNDSISKMKVDEMVIKKQHRIKA